MLITKLPTPKFQPTPILWTHTTHATHATHAKILWTHATHATHDKVWSTHPQYPRHPRYLADSQNICRKKRRQNLSETFRWSYCYNQEEWVEEFSDDKGAFYNGSENGDGDNDDKNYNENIEAVVRRCSSK